MNSSSTASLSIKQLASQHYYILLCAFIVIITALYSGFVEYRSDYHGDDIINPLCNYQYVRNCALLEDDSNRYIREADGFEFGSFLSELRDAPALYFGIANNVLLFIDYNYSAALLPSAPYLLIHAINLLLFLSSMNNVRALARKFSLSERDATFLYCLNPLMLFTITTLNKEIWGLWLITWLARAVVSRRIISVTCLAILGMFIRFAFGAFGLFLIGCTLFPKIRFRTVALTLCMAIPGMLFLLNGRFGNSVEPTFAEYSEAIEQRSAAIMGVAGAAQLYPFGPLLCWLLVGAVDVLSPILNPSQWPQYLVGFDIDIFIQQCSAVCFFIFIIALLRAIVRSGFRRSLLAEMFGYYFIVVTTFPISQHRYLTAGWPLLVLALLDCSERRSSQQEEISAMPPAVSTQVSL